MSDQFKSISSDDWKRSFAHVRNSENKRAAYIRAETLKKRAADTAFFKSQIIIERGMIHKP